MPAPLDPDVVKKFDRMLGAGHSVASAKRECGVSAAWAYERAKGRKKRDQAKFYAALADEERQAAPKPRKKLKPEAKHALECFACFRLRYTGRSSVPWQVEAAEQVVKLLESPDREYVVINAPPAGGKTTLFTHDIPLWLICRDRSVRILIGAAIQRNATKHSARLRRSLQITKPSVATDEERARGMVDAVATVSGDFGRFKPDTQNPDLWRAEEFSVAQLGAVSVSDKEPTVQSYGRKGGVLGNRVAFCIWDDLVDADNMRTVEAREEMQRWWKSTAETRINAGGLMILQGQRMGPDDLYRYALDMRDVVLDEDGYEDHDIEAPKKYKHIVYKAHYDELCTGAHPKGMKPWPESCLLDPFNLPWKEIKRSQLNGMDEYLTQFQQEDAASDSLLVPKLWVTGGTNEHGEVFPGCWDPGRGTWELPRALAGEVFVYATVDPSPTRWWGIQAWAYHPASEQHFLLDLQRRKMQMADFLDRDESTGALCGLAVDWQEMSEQLGHRITTWIVEKNAAQRFFFSYSFTEAFIRKYGIQLIAHETTSNKSDPKYGVQALGPLYRSGRVRLPGRQGDGSRLASLKLVDEVTKWPQGAHDDQVMAQWFGFWNLSRIYTPVVDAPQMHRPWRDSHRGLALVAS
jgi:hypothetical protein